MCEGPTEYCSAELNIVPGSSVCATLGLYNLNLFLSVRYLTVKQSCVCAPEDLVNSDTVMLCREVSQTYSHLSDLVWWRHFDAFAKMAGLGG